MIVRLAFLSDCFVVRNFDLVLGVDFVISNSKPVLSRKSSSKVSFSVSSISVLGSSRDSFLSAIRFLKYKSDSSICCFRL